MCTCEHMDVCVCMCIRACVSVCVHALLRGAQLCYGSGAGKRQWMVILCSKAGAQHTALGTALTVSPVLCHLVSACPALFNTDIKPVCTLGPWLSNPIYSSYLVNSFLTSLCQQAAHTHTHTTPCRHMHTHTPLLLW